MVCFALSKHVFRPVTETSDILCLAKTPDLQSGIYCNLHRNVRFSLAGFYETSIVCYIGVTTCSQLGCPADPI